MPSKDEIKSYIDFIISGIVSNCLRIKQKRTNVLLKKRRKWLIDYKKTLRCVRCDESHPATLTFHHKNNSEKSFEIGNALKLGIGLKRLLAEIEKCEVLCANCHAKEHLAYLFE